MTHTFQDSQLIIKTTTRNFNFELIKWTKVDRSSGVALFLPTKLQPQVEGVCKAGSDLGSGHRPIPSTD